MKDYKLIPFNEITDQARDIAIAWVENDFAGSPLELAAKHKLASDIMNYSNNRLAEYQNKLIGYLRKRELGGDPNAARYNADLIRIIQIDKT